MGGEKFDSTHPEGYLFGENTDLNFLGTRPVAVGDQTRFYFCKKKTRRGWRTRTRSFSSVIKQHQSDVWHKQEDGMEAAIDYGVSNLLLLLCVRLDWG